MGDSAKNIEKELIETFLVALKKGMTPEEFFAMADTTLEHLRGGTQNQTIERVIRNTATPEDVEIMMANLKKGEG